MNNNKKIEFYFKVLSRYDLYIQLADTKANTQQAILASILTIITALFSWGVDVGAKAQSSNCFTQLMLIISYLIFLCLCYSWYRAIMKVIEPALHNKINITDANKTVLDYVSTIFYKDVTSLSYSDFKLKVDNLIEADALDDLIIQVQAVASIVSDKFENYRNINKWMLYAIINSLVIILLALFNKSL